MRYREPRGLFHQKWRATVFPRATTLSDVRIAALWGVAGKYCANNSRRIESGGGKSRCETKISQPIEKKRFEDGEQLKTKKELVAAKNVADKEDEIIDVDAVAAASSPVARKTEDANDFFVLYYRNTVKSTSVNRNRQSDGNSDIVSPRDNLRD